MLGKDVTGVMVNWSPLHITGVWAGINGLGLMVTVTVNGVPGQVPDVGVTL